MKNRKRKRESIGISQYRSAWKGDYVALAIYLIPVIAGIVWLIFWLIKKVTG